jgi:DNA-binding winged helix-turn-helix (wHTH) protein
MDEKLYCFGDFRFFPNRLLLLRGDSPIRIGTRALDLLHLLIARAGEVVSKEELIGFAWPRTFVHDDNLKVNIAALRRAMRRASRPAPCRSFLTGWRPGASLSGPRLSSSASSPTTRTCRAGSLGIGVERVCSLNGLMEQAATRLVHARLTSERAA